jgi:hypothetical protein
MHGRIDPMKPTLKSKPGKLGPRRARTPEPPATSRRSQDNRWEWFFETTVPEFVKKTYSPHEAWKNRPFGMEDAQFFFRGIAELSDLFTDERPAKIPDYFRHPRFRSGYLLYFLPLQAAKFLTLFEQHAAHLTAELKKHAADHPQAPFCVADLGSGPATATLAFLLWLLDSELTAEQIPSIAIELWDTNPAIIKDGKALIAELSEGFPKLRGKVSIETRVESWDRIRSTEKFSLVLVGNVLNENSVTQASGPNRRARAELLSLESEMDSEFESAEHSEEVESEAVRAANLESERARVPAWAQILSQTPRAGVLFLEPAARSPSQRISRLRDTLLSTELISSKNESIIGPCLHVGRCPLAQGRDWCHWSVKREIPGQWFKKFSRKLGSEREWVKFSYLWIRSPQAVETLKKKSPARESSIRLVVSDAIQRPGERTPFVLVCEPGTPNRVPTDYRARLSRGDVIDLDRLTTMDELKPERFRKAARDTTVLAPAPKRLGKRQRDRLKKTR